MEAGFIEIVGTWRRIDTARYRSVSSAAVRFTPGARSAWHSRLGGQTLSVTEGRGLVHARGEHVVEIAAADGVFAPDGEEHWHGAAADRYMTHPSITEGRPHWGSARHGC